MSIQDAIREEVARRDRADEKRREIRGMVDAYRRILLSAGVPRATLREAREELKRRYPGVYTMRRSR